MKKEQFWEVANSKLNSAIGKLTVPAMQYGGLTKEVHQELLDYAHWFDEQMEILKN